MKNAVRSYEDHLKEKDSMDKQQTEMQNNIPKLNQKIEF